MDWSRRIVFVPVILSLLCIGHTSAYALQLTGQNWNSDKYFQGDGGTVTITLYNNVVLAQWYIKTVEIQFDWQVQTGYVYPTQVGENIASGQSGTYSIPFGVPSSVSVGQHSYTIYYVGAFGDQNTLATGSIYVHDMYEKQYDNMLSSVQSELNNAANSNYNSPDARSDLSQAQSYFVQATTLASQNQFQSAISQLNTVQSLINQANAAEQSYNSRSLNSGGPSGNNYYPNSGNSYSSIDPALIAIITIPIVAAGGGVVFWKMRKKNTQTKSQRSSKIVPSPKIEDEGHDAIHGTSGEAIKMEDVKMENMVENIPKIETKPVPVKKEKASKKNKAKKTKEEVEHDQKALGILKERLARGTITKEEYGELKKEFE